MFLTVPLVRQLKPMACWYASAQMLFAYKKQSVDPMDNTYLADKGIKAGQFVDLANAIGLRTIPKVNQTYDWSLIDDLLSKYGPIWAAGDWNGAPHIIVLTGVDPGGKLIVNDPAFAAPQERNMGWFNQHIDASVPVPMMYLP